MNYKLYLHSKFSQTKGQYSSYELDSCFFASGLILAIAFFTLLARIGFHTSYYDFFAITGVSLLLSNFSMIFRALGRRNIILGGDAIYTVCLFLLILLISYLPHYVRSVLVFLLSSAGFLSIGVLLIGTDRGNIVRKCFVWFILPLLLVLSILGAMYSVEIHHPLYLEKIAMGISNMDNLYHAAITEMIRNYGVPSSGLYGTPFFHYHFGSHLVFARFADLFTVSALEVYNFAYVIIIIPLYFRVALFLVKDMANILTGQDLSFRSDWLFWLIFVVSHVNFIPENLVRLFKNSAIHDSWLVSESYLFSIVLLFLACSIALAVFGKKYNRSTIILGLILFSIVLPLSGLAKVSTIMVAVAAGLYVLYRCGLWKSKTILLYVLFLGVIIFFVLRLATPDGVSLQGNFHLLHTIKNYTNEEWRAFLPFIYYFFFIAYALMRISFLGINRLTELAGAIRSRKLLDVEFLAVIAIVAFIPPALLKIDGGSGFYFLDIQIRVSIVFLSAWVLSLRNAPMSMQYNRISALLTRNSIVVVLVGALFLNNAFSGGEDYLNKNLQLRRSMIGEDPKQSRFYSNDPVDMFRYLAGKAGEVPAKLIELAYLPGKIMNENNNYLFFKWVADTSRHIKHKDRYYIGIPRTDYYWKVANVVPEAIPFILPALTGMAQSNGLPENFKEKFNYGYLYYHNAAIDSVNCKEIPGKEILLLVPNEHMIFPCP